MDVNAQLADMIVEGKDAITESVISADYARRPELLARYGDSGRSCYRRDNDYHLAFLAEAIRSGDPALFVDYIAWTKSMLNAHGVLVEDLIENLNLLKAAVDCHLPQDTVWKAIAPIDEALAQFPGLVGSPPPFILREDRNGELAREFLDCLLCGDRRRAAEYIEQAVERGVPLKEIYLEVFQRSQREIGRLWQLNHITVAQEHFCTAATLTIMSRFFRQILETPRRGYKIVAFCAAGDLHEIGLRIVADFFELDGWDCDYIGANTPSADLLATLDRNPPDVIAVSVTMTYYVSIVRDLIRRLQEHAGLKNIPVLVGGRPFLVSQELWHCVGADGWAPDAEGAVAKALELVNRRGTHA